MRSHGYTSIGALILEDITFGDIVDRQLLEVQPFQLVNVTIPDSGRIVDGGRGRSPSDRCSHRRESLEDRSGYGTYQLRYQ